MKLNSYVYIHRRKSDGEVFYVGVGTGCKHFYRSMNKSNRSDFWKRYTNKYDYEVDIVEKNISRKEAIEIEKYLISYFGRRDLGRGPLLNLTDGGEGTINIIKTEEQIKKWKKSNKGKQDGIKNHMFGAVRGKHPLAKEVVNTENGFFYDCALDASENLPVTYTYFKNMLRGGSRNTTVYEYADNIEKGIKTAREKQNQRKVINTETGEIFESIKKASESFGIKEGTLYTYLTGYCNNKTKLRFLEDLNLKLPEKRGSKKYVIDLETGVFYYSVKELSVLSNINYSTLKGLLNPNLPNKNYTSYRYI